MSTRQNRRLHMGCGESLKRRTLVDSSSPGTKAEQSRKWSERGRTPPPSDEERRCRK